MPLLAAQWEKNNNQIKPDDTAYLTRDGRKQSRCSRSRKSKKESVNEDEEDMDLEKVALKENGNSRKRCTKTSKTEEKWKDEEAERQNSELEDLLKKQDKDETINVDKELRRSLRKKSKKMKSNETNKQNRNENEYEELEEKSPDSILTARKKENESEKKRELKCLIGGCGKSFETPVGRISHMRSHHDTTQKGGDDEDTLLRGDYRPLSHPIGKDDYSFRSHEGLRQHRNVSHGFNMRDDEIENYLTGGGLNQTSCNQITSSTENLVSAENTLPLEPDEDYDTETFHVVSKIPVPDVDLTESEG